MNYKRFKYFTTSSKSKIRYALIKNNSQVTVVFFHGFMSDMTGEKPKTIQKFCKKNKYNFLKFEYSGHGKSSGKFINGNISKWTRDAKELIKSKVKNSSSLIFIGSSMGSWIALNLLNKFNRQIKGFIGIASAPDFLDKLMWKNFNKEIKKKIMTQKIFYLERSGFTYPLTYQLILDGRKNKIFNKKIYYKIPIVLFHGLNDKIVPIKFSKNLLKNFIKSKKKLLKIKNGDNSLSRKSDIKKICKELKNLVSFI